VKFVIVKITNIERGSPRFWWSNVWGLQSIRTPVYDGVFGRATNRQWV